MKEIYHKTYYYDFFKYIDYVELENYKNHNFIFYFIVRKYLFGSRIFFHLNLNNIFKYALETLLLLVAGFWRISFSAVRYVLIQPTNQPTLNDLGTRDTVTVAIGHLRVSRILESRVIYLELSARNVFNVPPLNNKHCSRARRQVNR